MLSLWRIVTLWSVNYADMPECLNLWFMYLCDWNVIALLINHIFIPLLERTLKSNLLEELRKFRNYDIIVTKMSDIYSFLLCFPLFLLHHLARFSIHFFWSSFRLLLPFIFLVYRWELNYTYWKAIMQRKVEWKIRGSKR